MRERWEGDGEGEEERENYHYLMCFIYTTNLGQLIRLVWPSDMIALRATSLPHVCKVISFVCLLFVVWLSVLASSPGLFQAFQCCMLKNTFLVQ